MRQNDQERPAPRQGTHEAPTRRRHTLLAFVLVCASHTSPPVTTHAQADGFCPVVLEQADPCTPDEKLDPGAAPSGSRPSTRLGNPISLITGNKTQTEIDYASGDVPLAFHRHYASANADANVGLGHGWRHSYAVFLTTTPSGDDGSIVDATGRQVWFRSPTAEEAATAVEGSSVEWQRYRGYATSDGYLLAADNRTVWHVPDGRRLSFLGSWLTRIDWPGGRHLTLHYERRQLATVTDETGRRLASSGRRVASASKSFDARRSRPTRVTSPPSCCRTDSVSATTTTSSRTLPAHASRTVRIGAITTRADSGRIT